MRAILTIDTTTTVCSVALVTESGVVESRIDRIGNNHSKVIGVFAKEILEIAQKSGYEICAVALSQGPGSYTGLRIGASFAKGFCYGNLIPLIAIPTLKIMASAAARQTDADTLLCPMIDARRMEVYSAVYDASLNEIESTKANIIDESSFKELLETKKIAFFGNGSSKCAELLGKNPNAIFIDGIDPLATEMGAMAWSAFNDKEFVDVAYFEPFYLKEFIATTPKNKILGNNNY